MLLIAAVGIGPLARMLMDCATGNSSLATAGYAHNWTLLGRTVALALSVAGCAALLGSFVGYRLGATAWSGKAASRMLLLVPLAIPPYLHAVGWTTLLGPEGSATRVLAAVLHVQPAAISTLLYSFGGAVLVLTLAYFPIAAFFAEKSLAWSSPSLVDAARVFGANSWQVFQVARWPQLRNAAISSAMITFLLAASELGVPTLLKVQVFNSEVFTQLSAFNDVTTATILTGPLLVIGLLLVRIERRVTIGEFQPDVTDVEPPRPASAAQCRFNIVLFALLVIFVLALPIGAIVRAANPEAGRSMAALSLVPMWNSLRYAGLAAAAIVALSTALTALLHDNRRWTSVVTDGILVTTFAVPSTIVALASLRVLGVRPWTDWISASALVVVALVLRYLIVGYRIIGGAMRQIPDELMEAAALDGAGPIQRIRCVVIPLLQPALLAALGSTFILGLAEIGSTILLYPPGGETALIAMLSIEANSPRAHVATLTLLQLLPIVVILAAATAWQRTREASRSGVTGRAAAVQAAMQYGLGRSLPDVPAQE
jgi:iron(III) transport system permease protein